MVRLHQRNYPEAERLLKRAILGFRFAGAQREAFVSEMDLGISYRHSGKLTDALKIRRQLAEKLERWGDSNLTVFAYHNLAVSLCEIGEYAEAQEFLLKTTPLLTSPIPLLRSEWLQGMIAQGQGDSQRAETHLLSALYGFNKYELTFDAALVSLELASVYLDENRWVEVKAIANEIVEVFRRQERRSEALAAVLLFRAAAELERVTVDFIKDLAVYLRQAALDPSFKFGVRRESVN